MSRVNDVATWLSHHGVLATEQVHGECGHAGAQLERIASDVGAGLIVAGAYMGIRDFANGYSAA